MTTANAFAIKIAIPSGEPDGVRIVEKSGWSGTGVDFPKSAFGEIKNQYDELQRPGVYVLWEQDIELPTIYVGQAEDPSTRIDNHRRDPNKDFWTRAVVFSGGLNAAHARYVEACLVELANKAKRCTVDNSNTPQKPELGISDKIEAEGFLNNMLQCLPVIGIRVFQEPIGLTEEAQADLLALTGSFGVDAKGYNGSEFIVLAGSKASKTEHDSIERVPRVTEHRQQLLQSGVLAEGEETLVFTQDYAFNSPSRAASVCLGRPANGWTEWENPAGRPLRDLE